MGLYLKGGTFQEWGRPLPCSPRHSEKRQLTTWQGGTWVPGWGTEEGEFEGVLGAKDPGAHTWLGRVQLHLQRANEGSLSANQMAQGPVASLPSQNCVNFPNSLLRDADKANLHLPRAATYEFQGDINVQSIALLLVSSGLLLQKGLSSLHLLIFALSVGERCGDGPLSNHEYS